MKPNENFLEIKVGAFVLLGLAVAGTMVVQFGRLGENFEGNYYFNVKFPDASGLYKGAEVLMSGAKIGRVADSPELIPGEDGVMTRLRISQGVRIPKSASFLVGSSGLLGDRFVMVIRDIAKPQEDFITAGMTVEGKREAGIDDITREAEDIIGESKTLVIALQKSVEKINSGLLSESNLKAATDVMDSAKSAAADIKKSSAGLENLMAKLDKMAVEGGEAAAEIRSAAQTINKMASDTRRGTGTLGALLTDESVANNLRALVSNLRARGILFYRDKAVEETERRTR